MSLFYLTAVKYAHAVVVHRLICTAAAACHIHNNTQLFCCLHFPAVAKIYKTHTILVTVSPGGGAVSPLTLSELLELGNTLQPRAVRRRRRRRHEGCLQCCIAAAASLSSVSHLSVFILHPSVSAKLRRFKFESGLRNICHRLICG